MSRIVLVYGVISGTIVLATIVVGFALSGGEAPHAEAWLGYLIMLIALSLIFVGVKQYRDRHLGGVIRFGTAMLVGLGISTVAGIVYTAAWEIWLAMTDYAFIGQYTENVIAAKQAQGLSGADLEALRDEMATLESRYASPLFRLPMTFLEIFPVGVLITLIAAAILRNPRALPAA